MDKECPFWREERECSSKECGIQNCDDEVPAGLRTPRPNRSDEVYIRKVYNPSSTGGPILYLKNFIVLSETSC